MAYTYLISGATSDVGRALIRQLLDTDPDALVLAQGCGDVEKLAPLCQARPGRIRPFDVDLSDPYKVDTFCQVLATQPAPTHFVHLAGLRPIEAPYAHFDEERFVQERAVTLDSALVLCKAILPQMAQAGFGRVVFLDGRASTRAVSANILQGALNGLALSLAAEYASAGVTVNCIAPGPMASGSEADAAGLAPERAAALLCLMLSEDAAALTGSTLPAGLF